MAGGSGPRRRRADARLASDRLGAACFKDRAPAEAGDRAHWAAGQAPVRRGRRASGGSVKRGVSAVSCRGADRGSAGRCRGTGQLWPAVRPDVRSRSSTGQDDSGHAAGLESGVLPSPAERQNKPKAGRPTRRLCRASRIRDTQPAIEYREAWGWAGGELGESTGCCPTRTLAAPVVSSGPLTPSGRRKGRKKSKVEKALAGSARDEERSAGAAGDGAFSCRRAGVEAYSAARGRSSRRA